MWNQTTIMAAIDSAKDDYGSPVTTVEVSFAGDDLRLAFKDDGGSLLAAYSVDTDGELTRVGD